MCTFQMRALTWLDWFNVAQLIPASDPQSLKMAPGLTHEKLMEEIHCVKTDEAVLRGARALRFLGMRMPLLIPFSLFMWVPGVIWVAEKVYALISRNRYILSRFFGCKDACSIMPQREREGEIVTEPAEK
jgi:predicted DCC family thiol-disulfide oxidoreductase YuxK